MLFKVEAQGGREGRTKKTFLFRCLSDAAAEARRLARHFALVYVVGVGGGAATVVKRVNGRGRRSA